MKNGKKKLGEMCSELSEMVRTLMKKFHFFCPDVDDDISDHVGDHLDNIDDYDVDDIDDYDDVDDGVQDVVGGLGGGFRVLACADTGSEDPPWRAPVLIVIFFVIFSFLVRLSFFFIFFMAS